MRLFGYELTRAADPPHTPGGGLLSRHRSDDARVLRAWIGALLLLYSALYSDRWSRRYCERLGMSQRDWRAAMTVLRGADLLHEGRILAADPLRGAGRIGRYCVGLMRQVRRSRTYTLPL